MKKLAVTLGILLIVGLLAAPAFTHSAGWSAWPLGFALCW